MCILPGLGISSPERLSQVLLCTHVLRVTCILMHTCSAPHIHLCAHVFCVTHTHGIHALHVTYSWHTCSVCDRHSCAHVFHMSQALVCTRVHACSLCHRHSCAHVFCDNSLPDGTLISVSRSRGPSCKLECSCDVWTSRSHLVPRGPMSRMVEQQHTRGWVSADHRASTPALDSRCAVGFS